MQGNGLMEGVVTKAANKLGIDQLAIRRVNSPEGKAKYGPPAAKGERRYVTSASVKQALDRGATLFNWSERVARAGKRTGGLNSLSRRTRPTGRRQPGTDIALRRVR